jgi:DnaJ-like protein/uncharacterized protein DUF6812
MYEGEKIPKHRAAVEVHLLDGSSFTGEFFVAPRGRVSDLLNDSREFLPFEHLDGTVTFIAKAQISYVTPLKATPESNEPPVATNPYRVLDVSESIDDETLRETYHQLCRDNHPDRIQAMGLSPEFIRLANRRMQAINQAYEQISRTRRMGNGH